MKKWILCFVALASLTAAGYLILGGYTPLFASDRKILRDKTYRFWECIQFKSFDQAAAFDRAEDKETTARLIERIFRIKPENLDIQKVDVIHEDLDRTGKLGRTKSRITGEVLNPKKPLEIEVMLFWEKETEWWLKLESSLR